MKRTIILTIFSFCFWCITSSQNCTQCDNSVNPPGTFASELGQNTTADGGWSFSGGYASQSSGVVSFSFGANCFSEGAYSVTLGHSIESYGLQSMVIGTGAGNEETELLKNNISQSLMIGFGSNKSTLFVKGASGLGYTGSIGIGDITNPLAKLHIKTDEDEITPLLFMEPHAFTGGESAKLRLGTMDYGISAGSGKLYFITGGNYIFNSAHANVGIGTLNPTEPLEVNGNIKQSAGFNIVSSTVKAPDINGLKLYDYTSNGITIKNSGKVGIGITSPMEKLEVAGNIKQGSGYRTITPEVRAVDANGLKLFNSTGTGITINGSGNVGIGTTNPTCELNVNGMANITENIVHFHNNTGGSGGRTLYCTNISGNQAPLAEFSNSGIGPVAVFNGGNVGIGTTNPIQKLDVAGTVNATNFTGNGAGLTGVPGDNFGNHTATQNVQLNGKWLSGDGENEGVFITNEGMVGIMKDNPIAQVDIADIYETGGMNLKIGNDCYFTDIDLSNSLGLYGCNQSNTSASLKLGSNGVMLTGKDGKLGIGTSEPNAILDVNGDIKATSIDVSSMNIQEMTMNNLTVITKIEAGEIEVKEIPGWKDCVFEDDYKLMTLKETENFIKHNRHLPGIPSENEVLENGINVGEMNALLLQKIEELTLYVIILEKKIELSQRNNH